MLLQTQTVTTIEYTHASKRVASSVSVLRRFGIYAGMAESADAVDLGSIGKPYQFKSDYPAPEYGSSPFVGRDYGKCVSMVRLHRNVERRHG